MHTKSTDFFDELDTIIDLNLQLSEDTSTEITVSQDEYTLQPLNRLAELSDAELVNKLDNCKDKINLNGLALEKQLKIMNLLDNSKYQSFIEEYTNRLKSKFIELTAGLSDKERVELFRQLFSVKDLLIISKNYETFINFTREFGIRSLQRLSEIFYSLTLTWESRFILDQRFEAVIKHTAFVEQTAESLEIKLISFDISQRYYKHHLKQLKQALQKRDAEKIRDINEAQHNEAQQNQESQKTTELLEHSIVSEIALDSRDATIEEVFESPDIFDTLSTQSFFKRKDIDGKLPNTKKAALSHETLSNEELDIDALEAFYDAYLA